MPLFRMKDNNFLNIFSKTGRIKSLSTFRGFISVLGIKSGKIIPQNLCALAYLLQPATIIDHYLACILPRNVYFLLKLRYMILQYVIMHICTYLVIPWYYWILAGYDKVIPFYGCLTTMSDINKNVSKTDPNSRKMFLTDRKTILKII